MRVAVQDICSQTNFKYIFSDLLLLFYGYEYFTYMYICVLLVCLLPEEVVSVHMSAENGSQILCSILLLTTQPTLWPSHYQFLEIVF